jgi:hypothetical protein
MKVVQRVRLLSESSSNSDIAVQVTEMTERHSFVTIWMGFFFSVMRKWCVNELNDGRYGTVLSRLSIIIMKLKNILFGHKSCRRTEFRGYGSIVSKTFANFPDCWNILWSDYLDLREWPQIPSSKESRVACLGWIFLGSFERYDWFSDLLPSWRALPP